MARVCHTNNCPVGVASQREELRARFPGAPEDLVNYFHFVAEEVRVCVCARVCVCVCVVLWLWTCICVGVLRLCLHVCVIS
jgi:hypothetical protein